MHNAHVQKEAQIQDINLQDIVLVNEIRGQVKFVGQTKFAKGIWYGIELNKPLGKNDGSVNGIRYFNIDGEKKNPDGAYYGLFCRRDALQLYEVIKDEDGSLNGNTALETIKDLRAECESLTSELNKSRLEKEQLKFSIENLNMNETESLSKTAKLNKLVEKFEVENGDMKTGLKELNKLLNTPNCMLTQNVDANLLGERNHLLQGFLEQTKISYDETMKAQEDLLEENTQLLEENAVLSKKISDLDLTLQKTNNTISDLVLQVEAQSKSSDIIERLTNDNVSLKCDIKVLNGQLEELYAKEKLEENIRITYEQLEQELRLQLSDLQHALESKKELAEKYIEENAKLRETLESFQAKATQKMQGLELKLTSLQEKLYQNKLLKEFYEVYESFSQPNLRILSSQLQYLAQRIESENTASFSLEKIQIYTVLKVLSSISFTLHIQSIENASEHLEVTIKLFEESITPISMWLSEFMERKFSSKQEVAFFICKFLKENDLLDKDMFLILRILHPIFETTIPKLLAFFRASNNLNDDDALCFIGSLYETSLSYTATISSLIRKEEASKQKNNWLLCPGCGIILSSVLTKFFTDTIFLQEEYDHIHALEKLRAFFIEIEPLLKDATISSKQPSKSTVSSESVHINGEDNSPDSFLGDHVNEENIHLKELLLQKENMLTELETKIKIFIGRDSERKSLEETIKVLQIELNNKNEETCCKSEMLEKMKEENANLLNCLKDRELNLYLTQGDSRLNKVYLEREKADRVNLISEIMELKEIVKRQIKEKKQSSIDFSWLDESATTKDKQLSNGHVYHCLSCLGIKIVNFVSASRILDLNFNLSLQEGELSHERSCSYIAYAKRKRKNIRLKSPNITSYKNDGNNLARL